MCICFTFQSLREMCYIFHYYCEFIHFFLLEFCQFFFNYFKVMFSGTYVYKFICSSKSSHLSLCCVNHLYLLFLYLLEEGPKNYYVTYIIYSIIYFLYIYCKTYYNYLYVWIYFRHVILVYSLHFFSAALFFLKISLLFILFTFGCVCT